MRWAGKLGHTQQAEITPGKWEDVITEIEARGELLQTTETLESGDSVHPRVRTTSSVSVLAAWDRPRVPDADVIYVTYRGKRWHVSTDTSAYPRVTYYIGEEYHGPLPDGVDGEA